MLEYKCHEAGVVFLEVNESNTTRMCSSYLKIPGNSPKGMGAFRIREWTCDGCGAIHDRDINASQNILRIGLDTLAEGALQLSQGNQNPLALVMGGVVSGQRRKRYLANSGNGNKE